MTILKGTSRRKNDNEVVIKINSPHLEHRPSLLKIELSQPYVRSRKILQLNVTTFTFIDQSSQISNNVIASTKGIEYLYYYPEFNCHS